MDKLIFIVENASDGGYVARALGTKMTAKAENLLDLRRLVREAVRTQLGRCDEEHIGFFDMSRPA